MTRILSILFVLSRLFVAHYCAEEYTFEKEILVSIDEISEDEDDIFESHSSGISDETKLRELLFPPNISPGEMENIENRIRTNLSIENGDDKLDHLIALDNGENETITEPQILPSKMSSDDEEKWEKYRLVEMGNMSVETFHRYLLAQMSSDEIDDLNRHFLLRMDEAGRKELESSPLLKMNRNERDILCARVKEFASLSDDTKSRSYSHIYKIRKEKGKADKFTEYEESTAVTVRCNSQPIVHLRLGDADQKIKIMFSYMFSVEAVESITPVVSDPKMEATFKKNHLLNFAEEELLALCSITRNRIPVPDVTFKDSHVAKPKVSQIKHLQILKTPMRTDVVIKCPFNPIPVYLRYSPDNDIKAMIVERDLLQLLGPIVKNLEDNKISEFSTDSSKTTVEPK